MYIGINKFTNSIIIIAICFISMTIGMVPAAAPAHADLIEISASAVAVDHSDNELYWSKAKSFPEHYGYRDGSDWDSSHTAAAYDARYTKYGKQNAPKGSYGYANDFAREVHRVSNPESGVSYRWGAAELASGDILHTATDHWVVVIQRDGSTLWTAEGDYAGMVRAGWGNYSLQGSDVVDETTRSRVSVVEAYHYYEAKSIYDDFRPYRAHELEMRSSEGRTETLNGTYAGKKRVVAFVQIDCGWSNEVVLEMQRLARLREYSDIMFITVDIGGSSPLLEESNLAMPDSPNYKQRIPTDESRCSYIDALDDASVELHVPWYCYLGGRTTPTAIQSYDFYAMPYVFLIDENDLVVKEGICTSERKEYWHEHDDEYDYEHQTSYGTVKWLLEESFQIASSMATPGFTIQHGSGDSEVIRSSSDLEWYLRGPATTYDPELSHILAALSRAAYTKKYVIDAFDSMGFADVLQRNYDAAFSGVRYTVGSKLLYDGTRVVLVAIRGTNASDDFLTDLSLGSAALPDSPNGSWHSGFYKASQGIWPDIERAAGGSIDTSKTKYVITGHSLGAAVADILEVRLASAGVSKNKVYGYNFACPDVAYFPTTLWKTNETSYGNIFNIGNHQDPVTFIPGMLGDVLLGGFRNLGEKSWNKFGVSRWYMDGQVGKWANVLTLDAHDAVYYVSFLSKALSLSSYKDMRYSGKPFGYAYRLFTMRCPVDVVVKSANGEVVASVIDGVPEYHNSNIGEVFIQVNGDEKQIAVHDSGDYVVEIIATGYGGMELSAVDVDLSSDTVEGADFKNVSITTGKKMRVDSYGDEDSSDVRLVAVDETGKPVREIARDGGERGVASIGDAVVSFGAKMFSYTGEKIVPGISVSVGGTRLQNGVDFSTAYSNNLNVGMAVIKIVGKGAYVGRMSATFAIVKAANPMRVTAKTAKVKFSKKKESTVKASKAYSFRKKSVGETTFARVKKGSSKWLPKVNKKTGAITVKAGAPKGKTYSVKVKVSSKGDANRKPASKVVTVRVKVK